PERPALSLGREETFEEDITDRVQAEDALLGLAMAVARRLRRPGLAGRTVTLKVKYHDFSQITRSHSLEQATSDGHRIWTACRQLLDATEVGRRPVRLLGITVSRFPPATRNRSLFPPPEEELRRNRLHQSLDAIADRFGGEAIRPGRLLDQSGNRRRS
ncbi:MAG: DNA polymerase IV, partial [Thermodesulfobacteriota bacterium]